VALAMTHPSRGPNYLESLLKADGIQVSFVTIQKILERAGLGSRYDRWLAMEKRQAGKPIELTAEQVAFIEKQNPQFKERHVESSKPGELLNQDTFMVGSFKGIGRVYMHVSLIPGAAMRSDSCMSPSRLKPLRQCCIMTFCRSIRNTS